MPASRTGWRPSPNTRRKPIRLRSDGCDQGDRAGPQPRLPRSHRLPACVGDRPAAHPCGSRAFRDLPECGCLARQPGTAGGLPAGHDTRQAKSAAPGRRYDRRRGIQMNPYRSCSCRDPVTKRRLPTRKPKKGEEDKRCPLLVGPYKTEEEAQAAVVAALGKVADGKHVDDRKITLAGYLDGWMEWKRGTLKPSTAASYAEGIDLYFKPGLGISG